MSGYDGIAVHLTMLADRVRTEHFAHAIAASVRPGDRVLDFGCGTGILSILAQKAGAERVYALDRSKMIVAAERVARDNGCDRIEFIAADADAARLPSKVDLIVSEWMGHFLLGEPMLEPLLRLRDRFLEHDGRMLPARCSWHAALVCAPQPFRERAFLRQRPYGVDFSAIAEWPFYEVSMCRVAPEWVPPESTSVGSLELRTCSGVPERLCGVLRHAEGLTAYGVCGWFDTQLADGIGFGTGPRAPETHWMQAFFPLSEPLVVERDEPVEVELEPVTLDRRTHYRWQVRGRNGARAGDDLVHQAWLATQR